MAGVKSLTSGLGAHAVICTANNEQAYTQSMQMLRNLGVLVCVGIPSVPFRLPVTPFEMIVKGKVADIHAEFSPSGLLKHLHNFIRAFEDIADYRCTWYRSYDRWKLCRDSPRNGRAAGNGRGWRCQGPHRNLRL